MQDNNNIREASLGVADTEDEGYRQSYTVREVAEITGTAEETVRRWIRRGELPAELRSRKQGLSISRADLDQFLSGPRFENRREDMTKRITKLGAMAAGEAALLSLGFPLLAAAMSGTMAANLAACALATAAAANVTTTAVKNAVHAFADKPPKQTQEAPKQEETHALAQAPKKLKVLTGPEFAWMDTMCKQAEEVAKALKDIYEQMEALDHRQTMLNRQSLVLHSQRDFWAEMAANNEEQLQLMDTAQGEEDTGIQTAAWQETMRAQAEESRKQEEQISRQISELSDKLKAEADALSSLQKRVTYWEKVQDMVQKQVEAMRALSVKAAKEEEDASWEE